MGDLIWAAVCRQGRGSCRDSYFHFYGARLYVPRMPCGLFRMRRPITISYRPILPAAPMLRAFLRLWGFIAVLRLRAFEIPTFQIHGGFYVLQHEGQRSTDS